MIELSYTNESSTLIHYEVNDCAAVYCVAESLVRAPIDLEYLEYQDGNQIGGSNLNTFEKC